MVNGQWSTVKAGSIENDLKSNMVCLCVNNDMTCDGWGSEVAPG